jgi:hypothetical protein
MGSSPSQLRVNVLDPYEEEDGDCLYWGTVLMGNAGGNETKHLAGGIRIMGENKLRIALDSGESMLARCTLMQVATKLAIGLGALFLVGVLLAAIPNHRAPVAAGDSVEPGQTAQGMEHASMPGKDMDKVKSNEKDAERDMVHIQDGNSAHEHVTEPKAGDSTR